ncbi:hypothetical protein OG889_12695 [Streptomyces sp. NBC_00481]|nr:MULTISPECIES: hypothetical protein [unclassified Streptomyces]WRY95513.1 hypothetical protein OG889_12695 [Streptomyces sp. NBC_00481]
MIERGPGRTADGGGRVVLEPADPTLIPAGDSDEARDVFVRHTR